MGRFGKLGIFRKPGREDVEICLKTMRLLGVDDLAHKPVGKLSGGQQQKVMICRALAKEPKILLLDEPFSNLDPESRRSVHHLIRKLNRDQNITTLVVTHDVSLVPDPSSRVVVMVDGRIVADASGKDGIPQWWRREWIDLA